MSFSSWFRQSLLRKNKSQPSTTPTSRHETATGKQAEDEQQEEELGLTEQLRDLVKSFTLDTFKNFPLQDDQGTIAKTDDSAATASSNVRKDLSDWQERHATLVLSRVKEISQLRYVLCPRHLKERQFWRIYFMLVKNYVAPYEIRAIQQAKLKRMGREEEKSMSTSAYEVEMAEAKQGTSVPPHASLDHDSGSLG